VWYSVSAYSDYSKHGLIIEFPGNGSGGSSPSCTMIPVLRESIIPAEFALQDILVPQNGVTPETLRRLVQGNVGAHKNGADAWASP
jgi:hypothetical protein